MRGIKGSNSKVRKLRTKMDLFELLNVLASLEATKTWLREKGLIATPGIEFDLYLRPPLYRDKKGLSNRQIKVTLLWLPVRALRSGRRFFHQESFEFGGFGFISVFVLFPCSYSFC